MTLANIVEKLQMMFPRATESMLVKEIDTAQKKFVNRTRLLRDVGELSSITSYISFALPSNFSSLIGIYYYDSDDNPIYEEELTIAAEVHRVSDSKKLTFRSTTLTPITALPTTIDSIQIDYYKAPDAIVTRNSTLSIPEYYWEALEMMAMVSLMKMFPTKVEVNGRVYDRIDYSSIRTLQQDIREYEKDAHRERNIGDDDRPYDVRIYSHAGQQYEAKRSKVTGSVIQIEGGDVSYTKYYRVTVVDDDTYEVQQTSGFGTINVAVTAATPVITITSPSNEFTDDPATWVLSNQETPYTWDNAGQITFTPYSTSFGTVEIEIFIY